MVKQTIGETIFNIFNTILLTGLILIAIYPMLYVAFGSISDGTKLMTHTGLLLKPLGFSLKAYNAVFKNPMILRGYLNTIFVVVVGVGINILMLSLGAYFLSRKNVLWKKVITIMIIFTMFFKGGLVPLYFTVKQLGLYNSLWSLVLTFSINTFYLIIMRTAFMAVPESIEQSGKIDGANDFVILFRLILPLCLPIISVMILYTGVDRWNGWFYALIFLGDRELYPLQLILREILIQNDTNSITAGMSVKDVVSISEPIKYATIIIATIPVLFIYPFLQKYFVNGVMVGSVKE